MAMPDIWVVEYVTPLVSWTMAWHPLTSLIAIHIQLYGGSGNELQLIQGGGGTFLGSIKGL